MKKVVQILSAILLIQFSSSVFAISDSGKYQIQRLSQGDADSIKTASSDIYKSTEKEQEVLDTLAETLLQNYSKSKKDGQWVDSLSWASKALGSSENPRYQATLTEVIDSKSAHKKLKKWAKKSLKQLGKGDAAQYTKGTIDIAGIQAKTQKENAAKLKKVDTGQYKNITAAKVGMSMDEVMAICGPPTKTTSHMTGKSFRPFNFKGGDSVRSYMLYKGQGQIVLSQASHYDAIFRVIEVTINTDETGNR